MTQKDKICTVYGPVRSWRLGLSLGIDLLFVDSICSFKCIYCQLGKINNHSAERKVYVPTKRVLEDLFTSDWQKTDVITFSGSGEPTLALNLGETIEQIKGLTGKPIVVLTNSAHLNEKDVREDLRLADQVFCKLDSVEEKLFQRINKPVEGITLRSVIAGIKKFRREYNGVLAIQTMYQNLSDEQFSKLAKTLAKLAPDEVQLNSPSRSIPREWFVEARGNYDKTPYPSVTPRKVMPKDILKLQRKLHEATGLKITSKHLAN